MAAPAGKAAAATSDLSDYQQVVATVTKVTAVHTGSGAACDVLTTPTTINIANLADILLLLNAANCPAVPYNRLHVEFDKAVDLMNSSGETSACSFGSYRDDASKVNTLQCSGASCFIDINGEVNVLAGKQNAVALDFRLKDFDVEDFGLASCTVTMKVSPIHGIEFEHLEYPQRVTGLVSNLTTSTDTFTLTKDAAAFTVTYSGITATQQPGLEDLLQRAQDDLLRTRVTASTLDYVNKTIDASSIAVKVEGLVSGLTATSFTLTYQTSKTMTVDYQNALVKGILADDAWAEVKLYGFDSATANFLAAVVEVEFESTEPDDLKKELCTED
jgi:hypothetical protein